MHRTTLLIGEPALQGQRDLPEFHLHEHVLVLRDELQCAQMVCEGEVDREIKCREGLWQGTRWDRQ
jgi:hypothetical protein